MYRWTDCKLLLWVPQRILLLLAVFSYFIVTESASNEFMPQTVVDSCPGDVLTYTCRIYGGGNTIWSGSAFDCETKMNEIILRHSQFNKSAGSSGNCNDGAITAQSLSAVNDTRFSSQLQVTVDLEMNNRTIQCAHSSETITAIGVDTISVATAPPTHVRLAEVRPGQLIFNWRADSTNRSTGLTNYTISSSCGACPIVTTTTMVICSALNLSTTPTICTFSVRRVACDTVGSPSLPAVVTLGVPNAPNVEVIPQYDNKRSLLTGITVRIQQPEDITSFSVTDAISGSIISYSIAYNGNTNNLTACENVTMSCDYTIELPSSVCSTSGSNDIDIMITVAAANLLGLGRPSEPITIDCSNQFVEVKYIPENATISCTFRNKLDLSPKSCSIRYGVCNDRMMYNTQRNTTAQSPFVVMLELNSSVTNPMNCYVVTASNDSLTLTVNGRFISETQSSGSSDNAGIIAGSVMGALLVAVTLVTVVIVVLVIVLSKMCREKSPSDPELKQESIPMTNVEERSVLEKTMKFEVYRIKGSEHSNKSISDTIRTDGNHSTFECKRVFYEFADGMDPSQYREIIEVPKDKLKVNNPQSAGPGIKYFVLESKGGIANLFHDFKKGTKRPKKSSRDMRFVQCLQLQELDHPQLKTGSVILYKVDVDANTFR